jgi:ribosome-associated protein
VIVHVQHAEERVYYSLERIWKDCPTVELPEHVRAPRSRVPSDADGRTTGAAS